MKRYVKEFATDILRTVANITNEQYRKNIESKVDQVITKYEGNYITSFEAVEQLVTVAKMTAVTAVKPKQRNLVEHTYDIDAINEDIRYTAYTVDKQAYEKDKTVQISTLIILESDTHVYEGLIIVIRPLRCVKAVNVEIQYEKLTAQLGSLVPPVKSGRTLFSCEIKSETCKTIYDLLRYCAIQWDPGYVKTVLAKNGCAEIADKIIWKVKQIGR